MLSETLDRIVTPACYTSNAVPVISAYLTWKTLGHDLIYLPLGYGLGLTMQGLVVCCATSLVTDNSTVKTISLAIAIATPPLTGICKFATKIWRDNSGRNIETITEE